MDSIAQIATPSGAKRTGHFVKIVAATAALAGLLFGFDTGVISGAILFIKGEFRLTPFAEELLVSAALIGAVCGSILSGRLTDLIGRKRAILITAGIFTVGSILCAIATSTGVLIAGRIAIGVAIGVASYTAPLYIGEMAPPKLRGGLVTLNQLAITVGILLAYIVDAAFAPSGSWRWLLLHRHKEEALKVLSRIRPTNEITTEVNDILEHAESGHGKLADLFSPV